MTQGRWLPARSSAITAWLAALLCFGVVALAWFGYRAAGQWEQSSSLLVKNRADQFTGTLVTALTRDMRAVQESVLDSRDWNINSLQPPYEISDVIAVAFARYPYPEVFFVWGPASDERYFFGRTDRLPAWLSSSGGARYPVEMLRSPEIADRILDRVRSDIAMQRTHSIFELNIAGTPYQVVARPLYQTMPTNGAIGGLAFLVNLNWVRENYFAAIAREVSKLRGGGDGVESLIADETGKVIPGMPQAHAGQFLTTQTFPQFFFDPTLVAVNAPHDLPKRMWAVHVNAGADPTLLIAANGARRTMLIVTASALALGFGLFIIVRVSLQASGLAAMRSEFVSTVTHELKTPVQVIRGIGETLIRGRVSTPEMLREYSQLLVQEGHRLTRLIENLLAYARITDVAQVYSFEANNPSEIVGEVLKGFHRLLAEGGFVVDVDVPPDLPQVRADRTALILALDNLVDNAMRYSGQRHELLIRACAADGSVEFRIQDRGIGIAAEDLDRVQRKFVRGRAAKSAGSGLGLAIVQRIAQDHAGSFHLDSKLSEGTTATLRLPSSL